MTVKELYIHINQGLQNIAAFVNMDIDKRELDYHVNHIVDKFIKLVFPDERDIYPNEEYSKIQASADDLRVLEVNDFTPSMTVFTSGGYTGKKITLPADYRHLLNDRTVVKPLNCVTTDIIEVPNRLTKGDLIKNVLENHIHKTSVESPVSRLTGNELLVYSSFRNKPQFTIENIIIDYIKKPANIAYGADGSSIIEFPDQVCHKLVDLAVIYISKISEQNPNKIQFLEQPTR